MPVSRSSGSVAHGNRPAPPQDATVIPPGALFGFKEPVDGFTMNAGLRYLPYRMYPLLLAVLEELRTAQVCGYRQRLHPVPYDITDPIPATETLLYQQRMPEGSILYGLGFTAIDGTENEYFFNIENPCTGQKIFSTDVRANWATPGFGVTGNADTGLSPVLLNAPIQLVRESILNIEVTNTRLTDSRCQLVLICAEPCESVLTSGGAI